MKDAFRRNWLRIPDKIRKPVVLTVGMLFVIAAGLTGWLPGPGGIPLFLIGVAILATEFEWAERLKRTMLHMVHAGGRWLRRHPRLLRILSLLVLAAMALGVYVLFLIISHL